MFKKNNFFQNHLSNSKKYSNNFKKSKKIYKTFLRDLENNNIPLLKSFEKNYDFDFSNLLVKNFLRYKNIIIVGIGGSILGTRTIYSFFKRKIKKSVFFFDNLDPNFYLNYKKIKNIKNSCFVVVSKSGNTLETIKNLDLLFPKPLVKNKLVIITELKESSLINFGQKLNAKIIEHKDFIGGRYSVLSETSMFPAALMNLDLIKFKNLNKLIKNKNFVYSLIRNVSSIYTLYQQGIRNSVILNYDPRLNDLGLWYQQLIGESLGKKGKGIMPIISTCPKDHHSLMQLYLDGPKDKFFTFFNSHANNRNKIESIINTQCKATKNIFSKKKISFRSFIFNKNDENELGSVFTFFVLEVLLLSRLMNVNPYDQPAVEQIKTETEKLLKSRR